MTSTRSTRSRFSSPHRMSNGPLEPSKNSANEGTKTFLDKWLEPTVQHRPSFEDHGLVRYGVVEGMAPLGELPKATLQKRKAQEGGHHPVRKIILRQSTRPASSSPAPPTPTLPVTPAVARQKESESREEAKKGGEQVVQKQAAKDAPVADEPMPSSPPTAAPLPPAAAAERPARRSLPGGRGSDDDEYAPRSSAGPSSRTPLPRRSLPRTSTSRRASGSHNMSEGSTPAPASFMSGADVQPPADHLAAPDKPTIDQVVEAAVDEAIRHYRYPTAWALRTLYDEKSSDPSFLLLLESIFDQTADAEGLKEFSRLVQAKKREGKKGNQACYYFVPPTTNSRFTPHKAKHAPYRRYITLDLAALQSPTGEPGEKSLEPETQQPAALTQPVFQQPAFRQPDFKQQPELKQPEFQRAEQESQEPELKQPEPEETPSKRKHHHRSRKSRHHAAAMDATAGDGSPSTPSRRRGRRGSASSDSSALSELENSPSLPSPTPVAKRDARLDAAGGGPPGTDEMPPNDLRPIRRSRAAVAAAHQAADTSQPTSPSAPTLAGDTTTNYTTTMPGRVSSPMFPNLSKGKNSNAKAAGNSHNNKPSPPASATTAAAVDEHENILTRRREARALTRSKTPRVDSSVRGSAPVPPLNEGWEQLEIETPSAAAKTRKTRNSNIGVAVAPNSTRVTRSIKRNFDEVDSAVSPTASSSAPGDAASVTNSRAATPNLMPAAKKQRTTGLRVKSSPVKKKGGTAAGLPRPSGEGHPSASNGVPNGTDDNDEYCSACGGVGDLVCCETCPRSFHFDCVDLGMSGELPDEWYCNVCTSNRNPPKPVGPRGGFGRILTQLERVNNQSFKLPHSTQTFFEGVKPGAEGDYEEVNVSAPKPQKKKGYDEAPDFFKITDAEGAAVLCHNCQHPSEDNRAIIPCSVCGLHWHLDCLDPPLAIPPVLRTWVCPAHADDLLRQLPETLAPAHKFRKIKNAPAIIPDFSRGTRNNGVIEVYDEPEDESGWNDVRSFGRVYRLPASGIKLDFIAQLRKEGAGYISRPASSHTSEQTAVVQNVQQAPKRSVMETQAALNLASLAQPAASGLDQLTEALITNADDSFLSLLARGNAANIVAGNLQTDDKLSLRAMLAQMEAMSGHIKSILGSGNEPAVETAAAQPARMHTPNDATSPPPYDGIDESTQAKSESVEADLPTPATIALDTIESVNGIIEKSSPANDSAMDLD